MHVPFVTLATSFDIAGLKRCALAASAFSKALASPLLETWESRCVCQQFVVERVVCTQNRETDRRHLNGFNSKSGTGNATWCPFCEVLPHGMNIIQHTCLRDNVVIKRAKPL